MMTLRYTDVQFFSSHMHDIKKITVISDTHGIIDDQITSVLNGSDMIVHAGDIMSISIIKKLKTYAKKVIAVAGNNDLPERYSDKEDKKITGEGVNNKKLIKVFPDDGTVKEVKENQTVIKEWLEV
mgnify:CR=1 FL=1